MQQEKVENTHLAGEVKLNGLDTDVLRAFRHCGGGIGQEFECSEKGYQKNNTRNSELNKETTAALVCRKEDRGTDFEIVSRTCA